ncbi:hypothetical protein BKA64DRAFT_722930 [Cadophora sp. MPI-SDFR-AT-0126]|nr:hypothetical protein BKA64DRAFT_722930 [Leotiomycetes sp. MPI-SDFR-AT-0126]
MSTQSRHRRQSGQTDDNLYSKRESARVHIDDNLYSKRESARDHVDDNIYSKQPDNYIVTQITGGQEGTHGAPFHGDPRQKSSYTDIAGAIIPIASFAGSITLATQLIINCPNTRLQALLATSSQLFLNIPLVLITVYIVLYGKEDSVGTARAYRAFIIGQFFVAGVLLVTAFLLLSMAIYVADTSRETVGVWGISLMGLTIMIGILSAIYPAYFRQRTFFWKRARGDGTEEEEGRKHQAIRIVVFLGVVLSQLTIAGILLGFGAHAAMVAPIQFGCPPSA